MVRQIERSTFVLENKTELEKKNVYRPVLLRTIKLMKRFNTCNLKMYQHVITTAALKLSVRQYPVRHLNKLRSR